jgi:hypothetical protein
MLNIEKIHEAIDRFVLQAGAESYHVDIPDTSKKERKYLGLSGLGEECAAAVWFEWRKVAKKQFPSRMLRLFRRGDVEEYRFMHLLRGIGFTVYEKDENGNQFKVTDFEGHLSGHMDGVATAPEEFWISEPQPFVTEYKSYNDKRFQKLKKEGVKKSDPKYFVQCQTYMGYNDLKGCLFCAVNKNDDELHFEWVPFDKFAFRRAVEFADHIIHAQERPERISSIPSFWKCSYCDFKGVCHKKEPALKSCRSCKFASPGPDASWVCSKGKEFGTVCKSYKDITK